MVILRREKREKRGTFSEQTAKKVGANGAHNNNNNSNNNKRRNGNNREEKKSASEQCCFVLSAPDLLSVNNYYVRN